MGLNVHQKHGATLRCAVQAVNPFLEYKAAVILFFSRKLEPQIHLQHVSTCVSCIEIIYTMKFSGSVQHEGYSQKLCNVFFHKRFLFCFKD